MKTRFFLAIAAVAIMAVSCSVNETEVINVPTSDAIALNPSTAVTRASITTQTELQANFQVYATSGTNLSGWYQDGDLHKIDGSNHHYWDITKSQWNFRTPVKWPKVDELDKYPMTFYAFYPTASAYPANINVASSTPTNLLLNVTVPQAVGSQVDIVATKGTANAKPATSNLTLTFGHILSKVNFAVTNTYDDPGDKAFVQAVGFVNINSKNTYNLWNENWPNTYNTPLNYNYYETFIEDGVSGTVKLVEKPFLNTASTERFYTGTALDNANLMLLPQTPKLWVVNVGPDKEARPATDEAYVRVMYRYEHHEDPNFIGFAHAQDHPDWADSDYAKANPTYNEPLYVYAVFTYEGTWVKGKGFLYNIPLPGETGGRLYDPYLYDDKGNRTDLEVPHGEIDKPIITSDEYIHLVPIVTEWGDDVPGIINN